MITATSPQILVIEDDAAVQQTLVDLLELNGYRVNAAANGAEALAACRREQPDLVLTDIGLPGIDGFQILENFRMDETLRNIPVIVVSAKVDRADTRRGMSLGADDFITKPFTENEVIQSVRARLEKKAIVDELDAFAHTVAHDLRNPLATLHGWLSFIEMCVNDSDAATLRSHLAEATRASSRLGTIIDELLVLAGVGRQQVSPEPFDMRASVTEAMARVEHTLEEHQAVVLEPFAWPRALGYSPWIVHVWSNYLSNAAKYAGPKAKIRLGATPLPDQGLIQFWVQDHGPGLSAEAQAQLFLPFTRLPSVQQRGHGLGLSIVRRIVEKLSGTVGVESEPGKGARFWFTLPADVCQPEVVSAG